MISLPPTNPARPIDLEQHLKPAHLLAGLLAFEGLLNTDGDPDAVEITTRIIAYVLAQIDGDDNPRHRNCPTLWFALCAGSNDDMYKQVLKG